MEGPEIVRAPLVVNVPVTSGNVEKSYTPVMVTGVGGEADAKGTEPIVKEASTHSMITNDRLLMFSLFIFNLLSLFWPVLTSHHEKSLAVHRRSAGNPARGNADT